MNAIWFPVLWALVSLAPNLASAAEIECPRPLRGTEFTQQIEFETYRVEVTDQKYIHLKGLDGEKHDAVNAYMDPGTVQGVVRLGPSGGAAQSYEDPYIFNIGIDDDGAPYFAEFHELPHLFSFKTCTYGSYESRRCALAAAEYSKTLDAMVLRGWTRSGWITRSRPKTIVFPSAHVSYELTLPDGTPLIYVGDSPDGRAELFTNENKRYLFDGYIFQECVRKR